MCTLGIGLRSAHSRTAPAWRPSGSTSAAAAASSQHPHVDPDRVRPAQKRRAARRRPVSAPLQASPRAHPRPYRPSATRIARAVFQPAERLCPRLAIVHDRVMDITDAARESPNALRVCWAPSPGLVEDLDAAGSGTPWCGRSARRRPTRAESARAAMQLADDLARIPMVAGAKAVGADLEPPVEVDPKDRRFADPAWSGNPLFYGTRLTYLAACRWARDVVDAAPVAPDVARKARMFVDLMLDAMAPDELPAVEPGGAQAGVRHRAGRASSRARGSSSTTCAHNGGRPRQVDTSGFEVGRNLAVTPVQGGVPQPPDGAAAVRAADRAGARHTAAGAARRGSTSTT